MITQWGAGLLAGLMFLQTGVAQKDAHALGNMLKGKQLVLRNYAAVPSANYSWSNGALVADPVTVHTFGVFTAKSVKLKGGILILEGKRATMVRNTKTNAPELNDPIPMRLTVDMQGADLSTVLPVLQNAIFFPDVETALAKLPPPIAGTLDISPAARTVCKCKWIFEGGQWLRVDAPSARIVEPKLLFSVEPEFSKKASRKKVAASVTLYVYVSETGHVGNIWLANSIGYGLDEEAEKAVEQYIFKPATYDGKPISIVLGIETSFQIF